MKTHGDHCITQALISYSDPWMKTTNNFIFLTIKFHLGQAIPLRQAIVNSICIQTMHMQHHNFTNNKNFA